MRPGISIKDAEKLEEEAELDESRGEIEIDVENIEQLQVSPDLSYGQE